MPDSTQHGCRRCSHHHWPLATRLPDTRVRACGKGCLQKKHRPPWANISRSSGRVGMYGLDVKRCQRAAEQAQPACGRCARTRCSTAFSMTLPRVFAPMRASGRTPERPASEFQSSLQPGNARLPPQSPVDSLSRLCCLKRKDHLKPNGTVCEIKDSFRRRGRKAKGTSITRGLVNPASSNAAMHASGSLNRKIGGAAGKGTSNVP